MATMDANSLIRQVALSLATKMGSHPRERYLQIVNETTLRGTWKEGHTASPYLIEANYSYHNLEQPR
jgi:hypothetical protein